MDHESTHFGYLRRENKKSSPWLGNILHLRRSRKMYFDSMICIVCTVS